MNKEMFVSATPHETRLAIAEDGEIVEVLIEREKEYSLAGSIYKGRVTRVLPGMQSAFVDIGLERDAFLYVSDFFEDSDEYERVVSEAEDAVARLEQGPAQSRESQPVEAPAREAQPRETAPSAAGAEPLAPGMQPAATPAAEISTAPSAPQRRGDEDDLRRRRGRRRHRRGGRPGFADSKFAAREIRGAEPQVAGSEQLKQDEERAEPTPQFASAEPAGGESVAESAPESPSARPEPPASSPPVQPRPASRPQQPPSRSAYAPLILPGESLAKYRGLQPPAGRPEAAEQAPPVADHVAEALESPGLSAVAEESAPLEAVERVEFDREKIQPDSPLHPAGAPRQPESPESRHSAAPLGWKESDQSVPERELMPRDESPAASTREAADREPRHGSPESDNTSASPASPASEEGLDIAAEESAAAGDVAEDYESAEAAGPDEADEFEDAAGRDTDSDGNRIEGTHSDVGPRDANGEQPRDSERADASVRRETGAARFEVRSRRRRRRGHGPQPAPSSATRDTSEYRAQTRPDRRSPEPRLIADLLREGQEILVQIAKEPLGRKGARITSHVALPGRYVVYMPTVNHIGVSRKIGSDEERARLKRLLLENARDLPGGFIVRTAGAGASEEDFKADVRYLTSLWAELRRGFDRAKAPALLHHDAGLVERTLRDQLSGGFTHIWVDSEEEYQRVVRFVGYFMPHLVSRVRLYTRDEPMFEHFGVQDEINKALRTKVWLKSGGYIVINQTEALVAIDVNTGKYVGRSNRLEDTIVKTNVDAIREIVRQIRLRDLGGIIVIDFIDMDERRNRQKVMQMLEEAMRADRAPSKVLSFNDFGLVALTRKRVKQSLERTLGSTCPYCSGAGLVKSVTTVCNEIYSEVRKIAHTIDRDDLVLRVNPEVARVLKARGAALLTELEELTRKTISVQSDPIVHQEQFEIF
jgi:Rne/Rng family ribonuclease